MKNFFFITASIAIIVSSLSCRKKPNLPAGAVSYTVAQIQGKWGKAFMANDFNNNDYPDSSEWTLWTIDDRYCFSLESDGSVFDTASGIGYQVADTGSWYIDSSYYLVLQNTQLDAGRHKIYVLDSNLMIIFEPYAPQRRWWGYFRY